MTYENVTSGGRNYLRASGTIVCPGYMAAMISGASPKGIIPLTVMEQGGENCILLDIDINVALKDFLSENGIGEDGLLILFHSIDEITAVCGEYLLDENHIVLDVERIYIEKDMKKIKYIFNPLEARDFRSSCKKLIADILGNYYTGYSIGSEKLRERLLRETNKVDFCPRNIITRWEELSSIPDEPEGEVNTRQQDAYRNEPVLLRRLKELLDKNNKKTNNTCLMPKISAGRCLTGICSINTRIPVGFEGITIGRNMLQKEYGLYNGGIGKTHARVYERDGTIFISDLGSKNGTYLNGEKLDKREAVKIETGDIVSFSDEEFILC
ncbi:MAG: FHA domain-containing protein [Clostridia bacterium]|nr:FHA domain-containing protein [Clostridia bacterium]